MQYDQLKLLCTLVCALAFNFVMGQSDSPVLEELNSIRQHSQAVKATFFEASDQSRYQGRHQDYISNQTYLDLDHDEVQRIVQAKPDYLKLNLGLSTGFGQLELYRVNPFSSDYRLNTPMGPIPFDHSQYGFYRGIISGHEESLVVLTMSENQLRLLISDGITNYRIHQIDQGPYVLFDEMDMRQQESYDCMTEDINEQVDIQQLEHSDRLRSSIVGNCVQIYFECDHKSYTDNGSSVSETEAWVAELFNEVSTLYINESIPISISEIFVWNIPDIYQGLGSPGAILDSFQDYRNDTGFNGRLAHFLTTRGIGGGVAYVNVLCSNGFNYAVSGSLGTNVQPFPNYSWNVNVIAHELGHNFGSSHTHSCVWNGNGTQIDDCGNVYLANDGNPNTNPGPCYDANNPIIPPSSEGNVMSYCHLSTGNGISFTEGFGDGPGDLIFNKYINANCNTGNCTAPNCVTLATPSPGSVNNSIESDIFWGSDAGANGYRITIGTTPTNGSIANNLDVGLTTSYDPGTLPFASTIYVQVEPYNDLGDASGCTNASFTTEPNVPPSCTMLTDPMNGASDLDPDQNLTWLESDGYELGYRLTIGTSPGTGDILNNVDVGNVTTFEPGNLPALSTIFTRITPYGTNGDTPGCPEETFTTNGTLIYCPSAGANSNFEWISNFSLDDFSNTSQSQTYSDFTSQQVVVSAGQTYDLSITPSFSSTIYQEFFKVWIDYNLDGDFTDPGEEVYSDGLTSSTSSGQITVPSLSDRTTRLRVSMKWNGSQGPCDVFSYGEVEDYTIVIEGTPCTLVTNTNASGPGSFIGAIECSQAGDTITFSQDLAGGVIDLTETFAIIDQSVVIKANVSDQITLCGLQTPRVFDVFTNGNLEIIGVSIVGGLDSNGSAIRNIGTLTLREVTLSPQIGASPNATLIENSGTITLIGQSQVVENN